MSQKNKTSADEFHPVRSEPYVSKRDKVSSLTSRSKAKVKQAFTIEDGYSSDESDHRTYEQKSLDDLHHNPAFDPSKFLNPWRFNAFGTLGKVLDGVNLMGSAVTHPKKTIKDRATHTAAGKIAKARPYISREADLRFLDVANDLDRAESSRCESDGDELAARKDERIDDLNEKINGIEEKRLSLRVAWQSSRHMQRVKVVRREQGKFPEDSFFEEKDDCGQTVFRWDKYIGYSLLYGSHRYTAQYIDDFEKPCFDFDTLRRHVERLVVVSADMQAFSSKVRRLYRWEDPAYTAKWMTLYFFLWYLEHIMTFAYGYIIYLVIMNYCYPASYEGLRESIARSMDRGSTAMKVVELMDRHGDGDWLGPLMDELGPVIQLQVSDIADLLERLANFYHWRSAAKTRATLFCFFSLFLICLTAPMKFCMKLVYFIAGLTFFVFWPISSRYPKYRLLVSPILWSFWDVPTHVEWSIQYLQEHSIAILSALGKNSSDDTFTGTDGLPTVHADRAGLHVHLPNSPDSDDASTNDSATYDTADTSPSTPNIADIKANLISGSLTPVDILSFRCLHAHTPGNLIISNTGIRFRSRLPHKLNWHPSADFSIHFAQLDEMRKRPPNWSMLRKASLMTTRADRLELKVRNVEDIVIADHGPNACDDDDDNSSSSSNANHNNDHDGSNSAPIVDTADVDQTIPDATIGHGNIGQRVNEADKFIFEKPQTTLITLDAIKERDKAFNAILAFSGLKWQNLQGGWDV